ncbi:glycosyltransferase family 39 protein [Arthrobacter sp. NPDC080031]|uniref:glycosyltransferase family 39 protein n=1 Tax=Arthrobacter sp. NPDC080031 TaxID=3155918 RepID=UPI003450AF03
MSLWNVTNAPDYQDDEGTYTAQAISTTQGSLAPYTYWYDHPPLGWIQLGALAWIQRLFGFDSGTEIGNMRYVMSIFFVVNSVLIFLIARRLRIRMAFSLLAVALGCLSPLSLVLGRQVFLDNIGTPWLLLAFYLALSPRLSLWLHVGAGLCFAVAVLSKETLAIFGPALLIALLHRSQWRTRAFSLVGFLTVGALTLSFYPLVALLRGELLAGAGHVSLQDALVYQFFSRSGSGNLWEQGSGRAQLVDGWMYYDKYLIVAGLVAAVIALFRQRSRWLSAGIALFVLPVVLGTGYLPTMYVIAAIPLLVLAIAMAADILWSAARRVGPSGSVLRRTVSGLTAASMVGGLLVMALPQWFEQDATLLASQNNSDWYLALEWTKTNVPRSETVLTPYSMWQDLRSSGWNGPWQVIALEKMDLDSAVAVHHPHGWQEVQWVIEGPTVKPNIKFLNLTNAGLTLDHSRIVQSFGAWHIRKVITSQEAPPVPAHDGVQP